MRIKIEDDRTVITTDDADKATKAKKANKPNKPDKTDNTDKSKKLSNGKKAAIGLIAVVILAAGFLVFRCNTAKSFPEGSHVNGVDVSGLTAEEAKDTILKGMNKINVKVDDSEPVEIKTAYEYGIEDTLETKIKLASVDPRQLGGDLYYDVPLTISDGYDKTAKKLKKKIPVGDDVVQTKDAYIDLDKMEIIDEVYGNSLDYDKLAVAIAEHREANPSLTLFEFKSEDYIAVPQVKREDLLKELKFDKQYLEGGMKLHVVGGGSWEISAKQLNKVIIYSERGPEYSEEGAKSVAKKIAKDFERDYMRIDTQEGGKELVNYVLEDKVDVDKTAESIYEAAKNGDRGKVYLSKSAYDQIETRVEVSISSQTCYFIKNGKVKLKTSVVTGKKSTPTNCGIFALYYKQRDVVLKGDNGDGTNYESPVSFWMPFDGGIGLHDATWRSTFGGSIWEQSGSHGCVNMPYDQAAKLYDLVDAGTVVIVYK